MSEKELPAGWRTEPLASLILEAQPGFAVGERDANGTIQLRMNNVGRSGELLWEEYIRVPTDERIVQRYALRAGDVVFNNTNSTELVGKSALFTDFGEPVVFSNHFTRLRTDPKQLEPAYLAWWLITQQKSGTFAQLCNRWIGQSAVKNDKLLALSIPLPPTLAEQRRIAAAIDAQMAQVARARTALEAQLAAAQQLMGAWLSSAFTELEASYGKVALTDLIDVANYGTSVRSEAKRMDGGVPVLRIPNVIGETLDTNDMKYSVLSEAELHQVVLGTGDILVVRTNGSKDLVGRCAVVPELPEPTAFASYLIRLRVKSDQVLPEYVQTALRHKRETGDLFEYAHTSAGQYNVSLGRIRTLSMPLPPLSAQLDFVNAVTHQQKHTTALITGITNQLRALSRIPDAVLAAAFHNAL